MKLLERVFRKKTSPDKNAELCERINSLTERLKDVRVNYDHADDNYTIDALIYEENALICRIEQLYSEAKAQGITIEPFER